MLAAYVAQPAAVVAQAPAPAVQEQARRLDREGRRQAAQRAYDRATLPLYLRALALARQVRNDTMVGRQAFFAGRTYFTLSRLDSAADVLSLGLRASQRVQDLGQVVNNSNFLGLTYNSQGHPDSVRAIMRRLQALYPRTKPGTPARASLDGVLAGYYQDEGQYARSLALRLAQLAYYRVRRDTARLAVALSNVGELFYLQGQLRQSLKYRLEGLRWARLDPSMRGTLPQLYGMLGKSYRDLGRLDSARLHYETALRLLGPSAADDPAQAAFLHSELGMVLGQQNRLALARQHSQQALAYSLKSEDVDSQAQVYYYAGDLELRAHQYATARTYLRRAYGLAQQLQSPDRLEPITRLLAEAEARTGHFAEAYRLRSLSAALLDSVHVVAGQQAMAAMEARYQNQDKQRQIGQLDRENRLRAADAASQRRAKYLAWAGVAGLLLVVGLIGFLLRQRQRTAALLARQNGTLATLNEQLNGSNAQLAEANETKAKLFSVISHDLRAPVGNLFQLLDVEVEAPELLDEQTRLEQTLYLRETARDLLGTMDELLAWSKSQLDHLNPVDTAVDLPVALAELRALYLPLARRKGVALTVNCPPGLSRRTDPNFLRIVLRNLVQNAIKFTPAGGTVRLEAEAGTGDNVVLRVRDGGPGLAAAQLHWLLATDPGELPPAAADGPAHGLGLRLTREFVAKLGGTLSADSVPGLGSVFTVMV